MRDAAQPRDSQPRDCSNEGNARGRLRYFKEILKKRLPESLLSEIREYRKNPRNERATYLRLRIWNGLGFRAMGRLRVPSASRSLLFVCFGNIIRSPMCEALVKRALAGQPRSDITVTSAGIHAIPGRQAHPWAISAASEMGIDLSHHEARLLTAEMVAHADAILAMDCRNVVELVSQFPSAKRKVYMLGAYAENGRRSVEIEDPYYGHEAGTRQCYETLQLCINKLIPPLAGFSR